MATPPVVATAAAAMAAGEPAAAAAPEAAVRLVAAGAHAGGRSGSAGGHGCAPAPAHRADAMGTAVGTAVGATQAHNPPPTPPAAQHSTAAAAAELAAQTDAPVKPQTWLRHLAQAHDNVFAAVAQQASAAHAQQAQQAHAAGTGPVRAAADAGAFSPRLAPLVVATVEAEPEPETSAPAAPAGPLPDLDEQLAKAQGVLAELHSTAKHTAEVVLTLRSQEAVALPRGVTALLTQAGRGWDAEVVALTAAYGERIARAEALVSSLQQRLGARLALVASAEDAAQLVRLSQQTAAVLEVRRREVQRKARDGEFAELPVKKRRISSPAGAGGESDTRKKVPPAVVPLPDRASRVLSTWMAMHVLDPYPTTDEKKTLAKQAGVEVDTVTNFMTNNRVRLWKPLVEQLISEMDDGKGDE